MTTAEIFVFGAMFGWITAIAFDGFCRWRKGR